MDETNDIRSRNFLPELIFTASRSSGPGGQNVNKVNTRVELRFNIHDSTVLNEEEKSILAEALKKRINSEGFLVLSSQRSRSQLKNKEYVIERFYQLISSALKPKVKRKPTRRSKAVNEKRLKDKKILAEKKKSRKEDDMTDL